MIQIKKFNIKHLCWIILLVYVIAVVIFKLLKPWAPDGPLNPLGNPYSWDLKKDFGFSLLHHPLSALANLLLLVPMSILARILIKNRFVYWAIGLVLGVLLEVLQPVLMTGVSDTLSITCLWLGWLIGYLIVSLEKFAVSRNRRS